MVPGLLRFFVIYIERRWGEGLKSTHSHSHIRFSTTVRETAIGREEEKKRIVIKALKELEVKNY